MSVFWPCKENVKDSGCRWKELTAGDWGQASSDARGACVGNKVRWYALHAVDLVELCFK